MPPVTARRKILGHRGLKRGVFFSNKSLVDVNGVTFSSPADFGLCLPRGSNHWWTKSPPPPTPPQRCPSGIELDILRSPKAAHGPLARWMSTGLDVLFFRAPMRGGFGRCSFALQRWNPCNEGRLDREGTPTLAVVFCGRVSYCCQHPKATAHDCCLQTLAAGFLL